MVGYPVVWPTPYLIGLSRIVGALHVYPARLCMPRRYAVLAANSASMYFLSPVAQKRPYHAMKLSSGMGGVSGTGCCPALHRIASHRIASHRAHRG
jgi:hypothetical protein